MIVCNQATVTPLKGKHNKRKILRKSCNCIRVKKSLNVHAGYDVNCITNPFSDKRFQENLKNLRVLWKNN